MRNEYYLFSQNSVDGLTVDLDIHVNSTLATLPTFFIMVAAKYVFICDFEYVIFGICIYKWSHEIGYL